MTLHTLSLSLPLQSFLLLFVSFSFGGGDFQFFAIVIFRRRFFPNAREQQQVCASTTPFRIGQCFDFNGYRILIQIVVYNRDVMASYHRYHPKVQIPGESAKSETTRTRFLFGYPASTHPQVVNETGTKPKSTTIVHLRGDIVTPSRTQWKLRPGVSFNNRNLLILYGPLARRTEF